MKNQDNNELAVGDIFYSFFDGRYNLYKLLNFDQGNNTYHVLCYEPQASLPLPENLENLEVQIYHAPIDKNGFNDAVFFAKGTIRADDLIGYHEFLRQTQAVKFIVGIASEYYKRAHSLTDEKQYEFAIDEYTKAIDLVPEFFEAIDNRAFCKMDLGRWEEAIEDFKESLSVNPDSLLAEFSIGECYLQLGALDKAQEQFEKAIAIDPNHKTSRDFLKKTIELRSLK